MGARGRHPGAADGGVGGAAGPGARDRGPDRVGILDLVLGQEGAEFDEADREL